MHESLNQSNHKNKDIQPTTIIDSPELWWSYNKSLDDDLVIITPTLEESTGPSIAGEIPLAKDPKFPESHNTFISNLKSHSYTQAQKAMLQAMSITSS